MQTSEGRHPFRGRLLVLLAAALGVLAGGVDALSGEKRPPVRTMVDGSRLTLLGTTYGREHDIHREHGPQALGPDIVLPEGRDVGRFAEDTERLGVWLRRDGAP